MATISEAIRSYLLADGAISAIIGTRLYPEQRPQSDPLPAAVYSIDEEAVDDLAADSGCSFAQVDVVCLAAGYATLEALRAAIRARCNGASSVTVLDVTFGLRFIRAGSGLIPSIVGDEAGTRLMAITLEASYVT